MAHVDLLLASAGFASALVGWVLYMATIPSGKVPVKPVAMTALQLLAVVLSAAGLGWGAVQFGRPGVAPSVLGAFAVAFALMFFWLYSQRKTPVGDITVAVGDPMLPFSVQDSQGRPFAIEMLRGKRVLFKFFRGGW